MFTVHPCFDCFLIFLIIVSGPNPSAPLASSYSSNSLSNRTRKIMQKWLKTTGTKTRHGEVWKFESLLDSVSWSRKGEASLTSGSGSEGSEWSPCGASEWRFQAGHPLRCPRWRHLSCSCQHSPWVSWQETRIHARSRLIGDTSPNRAPVGHTQSLPRRPYIKNLLYCQIDKKTKQKNIKQQPRWCKQR